MGDKDHEITFTGLFQPVEKKEPNSELVTMVKVPRHEYADLVRSATMVEVIKKLFVGLSEYDARAAVKAILINYEEKEEE